MFESPHSDHYHLAAQDPPNFDSSFAPGALVVLSATTTIGAGSGQAADLLHAIAM